MRTELIYIALPSRHPLLYEYPPDMPLPLEALRGERWIFLKPKQRFAALGMQLCNDAGFTPNIIYETMNWETIDAMVGHGIGVGFVPDLLTYIETPEKPEYRRIANQNAQREYVLLNRAGYTFSKTVTDFLSEIPMILAAAYK